MKRIITLLAIALSASYSYANFTLGFGVVAADQIATSPKNNEQVSDENGEGLVFRIGGDITSNASRAHTLELEITGLVYEQDGRNLYFNTNMLNYTYNRFFENKIYIGAGGGIGLGIVNIDKDIKDVGLGLAYQGIAKAGLHFFDRSVLVGLSYRWLGYSDLKIDDEPIVEAGDNQLLAAEVTFRF